MQKTIIFLFFAITILFTGCKKELFLINEEVSIGYNSEIDIELNDSEILTVKFIDLVEESRCPPGATCTWEGRVRIRLELNDLQVVQVGLGSGTDSTATYSDGTIRLLSVEYDSDDDFGDQDKCSAIIKVQ